MPITAVSPASRRPRGGLPFSETHTMRIVPVMKKAATVTFHSPLAT